MAYEAIDHYGTDEESITNSLMDRLEERDDSKEWTPPAKERQDNDRWSDKAKNDLDRSAALRGSWAGHSAAALTRSRVNPVPPEAMSDTDLRGDIENAVQWYSAPVGDRQTIARFMSDHQQMLKDAKALGIDPPKTMTDIAVAKNGMAQGASDPTAGLIHQVANAYGTSPSQVMQNFVAADNFIRSDPIGASEEILRQSGYTGVDDLLSRDMAVYANLARQSGTTLPEALGRYIAAEDLLERDAYTGLSWLAENYSQPGRRFKVVMY